jgi:hypothetical protein
MVNATGAFSSQLTPLAPGTLYHVRAYATNTVGTAYGEDVIFTAYQLPSVTALQVTDFTSTTAMVKGDVTVLGVPAPTQHGVIWSTAPIPNPDLTTSNKTTDVALTVPGTFTSPINGLAPSTTYYARVYVTNAAGTVFGDEVNFTTSPPP